MSKIWKIKPQMPTELLGIYSSKPPLLAQLLFNRGLKDRNQIEKFIGTDYSSGLHSPFLFRDMEKAVERIWQAIERHEKIFIYGDYDADAVTANAVLRQTFNYLGADCESYIPDRFAEGYGVNLEALAKIKALGAKLIITVDCGTNSVDAAEWCKKNGVDFIITDHHEIIGQAPDAFALINPKNPNDNYPDDQITGVGVAFKMAQAILERASSFAEATADKKGLGLSAKVAEGWEKWLLDLVAIGTVADCHALMGENRVFVKYGLKVLQKSKWPGLRALMASSGLLEGNTFGKNMVFKQPPDTYSLGFVIAPRLNAAGRLEHADIALKLLLENDFDKAKEMAESLEEINKRRQDITARIMSEAREQAEKIRHRKILVMMGEGWHKGVVGLVAGKIAEEFYRPTIVLEKGEIEATGSARSVGEFNIVEALKYSGSHLVRFGGHKQAAGLTLKNESFDMFYQSILSFAEENFEQEQGPVLYLDAELSAPDLSLATYNLVTALEPFGVGNPKPKFLLKALELGGFRAVGGEKQHLQMQLKKGSVQVSAIAFNMASRLLGFMPGACLDIVCELLQDTWNGRNNLKLRVLDFKNNNE